MSNYQNQKLLENWFWFLVLRLLLFPSAEGLFNVCFAICEVKLAGLYVSLVKWKELFVRVLWSDWIMNSIVQLWDVSAAAISTVPITLFKNLKATLLWKLCIPAFYCLLFMSTEPWLLFLSFKIQALLFYRGFFLMKYAEKAFLGHSVPLVLCMSYG